MRLHTLFSIFCGLLLAPNISNGFEAQLDITISQTNNVEEATIVLTAEDILSFETLQVDVWDANLANEGRMYINFNSATEDLNDPDTYIALFQQNNANNQDTRNRSLELTITPNQRARFREGPNRLTFYRDSGMGYFIIYYLRLQQPVKQKSYAIVTPNPSGAITENMTKALKMYKRIVGVTTPIDNPMIQTMAQRIANGNLEGAARVAMSEGGFYNHVVRDMAARMSTREKTVETGLNDFIATLIGVTRDGVDARELLTGNFTYQGVRSDAPRNPLDDILTSNNHYQVLEADNYDIATVIDRVEPQEIRVPASVNGTQRLAHPDPAGLITSRAFMGAHAIAGTNRRLVEFTMEIFTCNPIVNYADATAPDIMVGQDIDRFPGGDGAEFQTNCKACHGIMDGLRPAFAKFDFENSFVKYADYYSQNDSFNDPSPDTMRLTRDLDDPSIMDPASGKMTHNYENTQLTPDSPPAGYLIQNSNWRNFALSDSNRRLFGWREPASGSALEGTGVNELGRAVANSRAFSNCMVKRVFTELCRREPVASEQSLIENIASDFEFDGYNLKTVFEKVISRPECIGR